MSIEVMKQALEALEYKAQGIVSGEKDLTNQAITSLRQAIAEAEKQEPIGEIECIDIDEDGQPSAWVKLYDNIDLGDLLYTHPQPKQQPAAIVIDGKLMAYTNAALPEGALLYTKEQP